MRCKVGSPEFDGHSGIERLRVTDRAGLVGDTGRECGVVSVERGEGATSRCAGIIVAVYWESAFFMDEDDVICDG